MAIRIIIRDLLLTGRRIEVVSNSTRWSPHANSAYSPVLLRSPRRSATPIGSNCWNGTVNLAGLAALARTDRGE